MRARNRRCSGNCLPPPPPAAGTLAHRHAVHDAVCFTRSSGLATTGRKERGGEGEREQGRERGGEGERGRKRKRGEGERGKKRERGEGGEGGVGGGERGEEREGDAERERDRERDRQTDRQSTARSQQDCKAKYSIRSSVTNITQTEKDVEQGELMHT